MHFLVYFALSLFVGLNLLFADEESVKAFQDDRPNIIFFLTDDQRNDFLGCTGHPIVKTPRIDNLANNGRLFDNAFVSTSICAASRATLLTGLYERTHRFTFGTPPVADIHISEIYPALLKKKVILPVS